MLLNCAVESPLDCREIQPVHSKGNQSWRFTGRTEAEAETPILWPPDEKNWLLRKDPDAGKDWRQEEKGMTEDEMVGWYHWLNGQEFEQAAAVGDGQGSLACCSPRGHKELDTIEWLNWQYPDHLWVNAWFFCPESQRYKKGLHDRGESSMMFCDFSMKYKTRKGKNQTFNLFRAYLEYPLSDQISWKDVEVEK